MKEEKRNLHKDEGALRIMEALSAVDEELLEQSGMPGSRSLWRYSHMAAACLALVVVGAVSWSGLRLAWVNWESNNLSGSSGGGQTGAISNQETAQGMKTEESMNTATEGMDEGYTDAEVPKTEIDTGGINGGSDGTTSEQESYPATTEEGIICNTPCPPDNRQAISEEQARASELGAYLPHTLPAGYSFESARVDDQGQLYLCWISGMDTIRLSVTYVEAGELETVDISRPETYDERLYKLPYGETVPREYWAVFDNPVFLAEDFCLETVASRMISYQDAGDTDTPTGRFRVLYPDGVLVGFDGDGSAEDIWTMFSSLWE